MSRRERTLAIAVAALVVLVVGYLAIVVPVMGAFEQVSEETAALEKKLNAARVLVEHQEQIDQRWAGYRAAGLHTDEFEARRRTQESITQWSAASRLEIQHLEAASQATRDPDERFDEITFRLSGKGTIRSLQLFLEKISASPFPLRIVECSISNRRAGESELDLTLTLSTIIEPDVEQDSQAGGAS